MTEPTPSDVPAPSRDDLARYLEIRKRGKRGGHISRDDIRFIETMMKKYGHLLGRYEREIFVDTAPFGSYVGMDGE